VKASSTTNDVTRIFMMRISLHPFTLNLSLSANEVELDLIVADIDFF
jgi:hypothetical protein